MSRACGNVSNPGYVVYSIYSGIDCINISNFANSEVKKVFYLKKEYLWSSRHRINGRKVLGLILHAVLVKVALG
jgi:hypothetical protein